ncbi:Homoisocitrate dehydrogenase [compost metagenome]
MHGSAPDIAGKDMANPTALLLAAALMLEHKGLHAQAKLLRDAIDSVLSTESGRTVDLGGTVSTSKYGDLLIERIRDSK